MSAKFLNSVERIQQLNKPLFLVIYRRELAEFCKKFVDLWFSAKCTVHSKRINSVHYYINSVKTNSIMSTPTTYESFLSPKCFFVLVLFKTNSRKLIAGACLYLIYQPFTWFCHECFFCRNRRLQVDRRKRITWKVWKRA